MLACFLLTATIICTISFALETLSRLYLCPNSQVKGQSCQQQTGRDYSKHTTIQTSFTPNTKHIFKLFKHVLCTSFWAHKSTNGCTPQPSSNKMDMNENDTFIYTVNQAFTLVQVVRCGGKRQASIRFINDIDHIWSLFLTCPSLLLYLAFWPGFDKAVIAGCWRFALCAAFTAASQQILGYAIREQCWCLMQMSPHPYFAKQGMKSLCRRKQIAFAEKSGAKNFKTNCQDLVAQSKYESPMKPTNVTYMLLSTPSTQTDATGARKQHWAWNSVKLPWNLREPPLFGVNDL